MEVKNNKRSNIKNRFIFLLLFLNIFFSFLIPLNSISQNSIQIFDENNTLNDSSSVADITMDWPGNVLPSTMLYGLQENRIALTDLEDVEIVTSNPIVETQMKFSNLNIENFTYMLETLGNEVIAEAWLQDIYYFQQIKIPTNCYIEWASILIQAARASDVPFGGLIGLVPVVCWVAWLKKWARSRKDAINLWDSGSVRQDSRVSPRDSRTSDSNE